jgi:uncharacterized protein (DUF2336 family)
VETELTPEEEAVVEIESLEEVVEPEAAEEAVEEAVEAAPAEPAPEDHVTWARVGGENSWHIVESIKGPRTQVLDGRELLFAEFRADLGAEKSCEVCMRVYMQGKDL